MADDQDQVTTNETRFAASMNRVRLRFAIRFADHIQITDAALAGMTGATSDAADAVATAYRWLHDVCGIAPTIGFEATGRCARSCTDILVEAFRAQRGLSADEFGRLAEGMEALRTAARTDMKPTD